MRYSVSDWLVSSCFLHSLSKWFERWIDMMYNIRTKELDIDEGKEVEFDVIADDLIEKEKQNKLTNNDNNSAKAYQATNESSKNQQQQGEWQQNILSSQNQNQNQGWGGYSYRPPKYEGSPCAYCGFKFHSDEQCWLKHSEQAPSEWLEFNKERIDDLWRKWKSVAEATSSNTGKWSNNMLNTSTSINKNQQNHKNNTRTLNIRDKVKN